MTKPKRKRKHDDSNNTTSSQSSIECIMIKPNYTNLNDEEKKGIMVLDEEEKEYVIFLSADLIFVRVFLFLDVQLTLSIFCFSFPFLSLARKVSERKRTEVILSGREVHSVYYSYRDEFFRKRHASESARNLDEQVNESVELLRV